MEEITLVIDGTSGDVELEKHMALLLNKLFEIFKSKQASYGSTNISEFGEKGVIIRMNDKIKRIIRLRFHDLPDPLKDENAEDTYIDLADYSLIALLCMKKLWPGVE